LSPLELELAQRLCQNLIFVGDENQAINAWKRGDAEAIHKIREVCDSQLDLKTSFRLCPNHAEYANQIKPGANIKTLPGKQDGVMENINPVDLIDKLESLRPTNPMLLCRYNAPLVKLAFRCTTRGVPVRIKGSQIIENIIQTVKNRNATSMLDLHQKLDRYEDMCLRSGDEMAKEVTRDKFEAIRYILEESGSIEAFETTAKDLLAPRKGTNAITLLTIHRSKGLENDNVIVTTPIESSKAKTDVQKEQEKNVHFVASTRSKSALYTVS
jgi:superfamily I DNA/RNA helicase